MMTLDIAIATHKPDGAGKVAQMLLPPQDGVRYVVSWQSHEDAALPPALLRADVKLLRFSGKGVSANRNNALEHCTADIVLIADDDITYTPDAFRAIMGVFEKDPRLDIATFRADSHGKSGYPAASVELKRRLPKGYSVSAIEIACRRCSITGLRFCTELGSGRYAAGEDEFFLKTALRQGLRCRYFPITVCSHPHASTGQRADLDAATLRGFGCVIALLYPLSAVARIPLKAWRLWRSGRAPFGKALAKLTAGALAAPGIYLRFRKQQNKTDKV